MGTERLPDRPSKEAEQTEKKPSFMGQIRLKLRLWACERARQKKPLSEKIRLEIIDCLIGLNRWEEAHKESVALQHLDEWKVQAKKSQKKYERK